MQLLQLVVVYLIKTTETIPTIGDSSGVICTASEGTLDT